MFVTRSRLMMLPACWAIGNDVVDLDVRVSVTGQKGRARSLAHSAAVAVVDADEVGQL